MNKDTENTQGEEALAKKVDDMVSANRAYTVTIQEVDDEFASVTMGGSEVAMKVPITGINIGVAAINVKPNVGSLAIIQFADGDQTRPFFVSYSEIDFFSFTRGTTLFSWEMTPQGREETEEATEIEGETEDVINLTVGESTLKVDKEVWEFNGGTLGGMVLAKTLQEQLAKLTARVDGIIDGINSPSVIATPQDGGDILWGLFQLEIAKIVDVEDFSEIENEKITQ